MKKKSFLLYLLFFCVLNVSFSQSTLTIADCSSHEFSINDNSDSDGDGNVCEAKIVLSNYAFYSDGVDCSESNINWNVKVDLWDDGVIDVEYDSSLPPTDNSWDDTNGNGIPDIYVSPTIGNEVQDIQLPDIEGPKSDHSVIWSVSDECDKVYTCTTEFLVLDKTSPTPFCVSLATVVVGPSGTEIYAKDFNVGVFDNCTPQDEIRISFSGTDIVPSRLITCDDIVNSPITQEVYFWDNNDNIDFCTVFISVVPQGGGLDCHEENEIFGQVRSWNDDPIEGVEVHLDANLPEYPLTTLTDADGFYSFGVFPEGVDYTLSATHDDNDLNNVSTLDLVLIQRNILGLQPFSNPYRILSSDTNGDYDVKVNDLYILRRLILGVIPELPNVDSWRFIDAEFNFIDPLNPFPSIWSASQNPFSIEFNEISEEGYDFIGMKTGDVSD